MGLPEKMLITGVNWKDVNYLGLTEKMLTTWGLTEKMLITWS